jgi:hypothetical protein
MSNSRLGSSYLTPGASEVLEHQLRTTHPGMAHFANTGPFGATCGNCGMLGYHRQHRNTSGDLIKTTFTHGCAKFYAPLEHMGRACRPTLPRADTLNCDQRKSKRWSMQGK